MIEAPRPIRTTCPYCGVGCGVLAKPAADGTVAIAGDPEHPANFGRLCSKGSALGETLSLDGRLLHPTIHGRRTTWDDALDLVATRFKETIAEHGPDSVAFYVSGQLLTEDYYVANKLMKGFIGSANIDTNSRLCMASSVAGHKRAFGSDTVPGTYEDFEAADLVVLVGSNLAWCHPVLFQRLAAAKASRPELKIVVIDPRRTATAEMADLFLPLAPGSDVALFNGLFVHLHEAGWIDQAFVDNHTSGLADALTAARATDLTAVAAITHLPIADLAAFYQMFAATERAVTVYSQGVNQSSRGTDKVNAIINCHLLTGRIGRPGMGPFSVTGQPNAMGGREVGGLANQLAAHMDLENADHRRIVQAFWDSPTIADRPGLKAVDLFRAIGEGRIKALWIAGTNPVDSLPDADAAKAALLSCPFVVVSDVVERTDTTACGHVLLPAAAWGEKDGTVTNSERRISRQRPFLPVPGQARPDWWIFAQVGRRMGWPTAFAYRSPADVFAEFAALSGVENEGQRDFDISGLVLDPAAYEALPPVQWPRPHGIADVQGSKRFFADGRFFTPNRRGRFIATSALPPLSQPDGDYPFVLNTGRIRDQWHTMTRSAKAARLMDHMAEPFAEIHPDDADALGIASATIVEVENGQGRVLARALITPRQRRGSVFLPLHWNDQYASQARVDTLTLPHVDAVSGQPESKFTPVAVRPYAAVWYGYAVTVARPQAFPSEYWAIASAKRGWRVELAGRSMPEDWKRYAVDLFGCAASDEVLYYEDRADNQIRLAVIRDGTLIAALYVASSPVAVVRSWLTDRLGQSIAPAERLQLLAGRAAGAAADPGAIVCSCFGVGLKQIVAAIHGGCTSVAAVGAALRAGTNCGSCRTEIDGLIRRTAVASAAE